MKKRAFAFALALWLVFSAMVPAFSASSDLDTLTSYTLVNRGEPSEFGYQDYAFVDENGNEAPAAKSSTLKRAEALPQAFDARDLGIVPTVRDQGNSGNCWCFATMGTMEVDAAMNHGAVSPDFSEAHLSWFTNHNAATDTNDRTYGDAVAFSDSAYNMAGNVQFATYTLLRGIGAAKEADYPFYPYDLDSMGNYDESSRYDRGSGYLLTSSVFFEDGDTAAVKNWIIDHGSVQVGINFDYSCFNSRTCSYYNGTADSTNHAVMVIGWDDNYSASNFRTGNQPASDGAWLVRNSWGDYYNEDGVFWLSYEDQTVKGFSGQEVSDRNEYNDVYTYNGFGYNNYYSSTGTFKGANVYTADEAALLKAVGVFCRGSGCTVKIEVYKNLPASYSRPNAGTLACSFTATEANAGYYVIDLPEALSLAAGEIYAVVAQIGDNTGTNYLFVEKDNTANGYDYSSQTNQSYYYLNSSWKDTTSLGVCNTCINAITACAHNYQITAQSDAGCETEGSVTYTCTKCGQSYDETVAPLGHSYEPTGYVAPTCTEQGVTVYTCIHCHGIYSLFEPAAGHQYESTVVEPTCTTGGYTLHRCIVCKDEYTDCSVEAKGHRWSGEYTVDTEPTCSSEGCRSVHCLDCEAVTCEEAISKLTHCAGDWHVVAAGSGTILAKTCLYCGKVMAHKDTFVMMPQNAVTLGLFDRVNLRATAVGITGKVVYTSSDHTVATVDDNGRVFAIGDGVTVITARAEGSALSDTCTVTVHLTAGERLLRLLVYPWLRIFKILY